MHSKNNNSKSQNFIQGLRPFSSSIPRGLKKILKKGGYNFNNIVDNWTKMVGKEISKICYPCTIKIEKSMTNGILIINVIHGKELEVEYKKKEIIDKINGFFGYNCIENIKLKIVQEKKMTIKKNKNIYKKDLLKDKINLLKNDNLKTSLNKLIKAFNSKND